MAKEKNVTKPFIQKFLQTSSYFLRVKDTDESQITVRLEVVVVAVVVMFPAYFTCAFFLFSSFR